MYLSHSFFISDPDPLFALRQTMNLNDCQMKLAGFLLGISMVYNTRPPAHWLKMFLLCVFFMCLWLVAT